MRVGIAFVVAVMLSGCMVLPKTRRDLTRTRVERTDGAVQELGPRLVDGRIHSRTVTARAVRSRWCTATVREIADYRIHKGARMSWPSIGGSDGAGLVLVLFSIYTLPISGAITGIIVATSDDHHEQTVRELPAEGAACDLPLAGASVWLAIAGDAELRHATAGDDGAVRFDVTRALRRGDARMGLDGVTPPSWPVPAAAR